MRRNRSRNLDVVEYTKSKAMLGSNLINPTVVLKAKIANIKEDIAPIYIQIEELERKMSVKKHLLNQCRTLALANTQILLSNPDILYDIDFDIVECIISKFRLEEGCSNDQIGGNFTTPEKNYIINCAKLEMKWKEMRQEKLENNPFGRLGTFRGVYKSDLIYPSPAQTKVKILLTSKNRKKITIKLSLETSQIQKTSSISSAPNANNPNTISLPHILS